MKHMGVTEIPEDRWPDTRAMTIPPSRVSVVHSMSGTGYLVQVFREPNEVVRLTVCSTDATLSRSGTVRFAGRIPWDDLQEVKRVMGYGDQDAVEIYPPTQDVVNRANMRHLWVLPEPLPFAWRSVRSATRPASVKRGSMVTRALEIPLVPTSKNVWQRCHWAKRGSIKKAWHEEVWAGVNISPHLPGPVGSVTCSMYVYWDKPGVLPDWINLDMVHECVADGLVEAGILEDDAGGAYVRGSFGIERVKKGQGRTIIRLDCE